MSYREFLERINMTQEVTDKLVRMAGERDDSFAADERAFGALSGMQGNALNRESEGDFESTGK